jgi:hypothetical protein
MGTLRFGKYSRSSSYTSAWMPTGDEVPQVATGGNEIVTVGSTKYHIFTSSGTFTRGGVTNVQIMTVGGGGGGGLYFAGGGGGGEIDLFASFALSDNLTVTIGAAGTGSTSGNQSAHLQSGGTSTVVEGATTLQSALGGGGGGNADNGQGATGGSGGGGGGNEGQVHTAGAASGSNTNAGGSGGSFNGGARRCGGGGGGATAAGAAASNSLSAGSTGGQGYTLTTADANLTAANFPTSLSGITVISSGGGGGCYDGYGSTHTARVGGTGGGTGGVRRDSTTVSNPTAATSYGSGGGGEQGSSFDASPSGKNGFAGLVIIKYTV